jgi:hypothetical protein
MVPCYVCRLHCSLLKLLFQDNNNKQRHYKAIKLHLLQEQQCVCLHWQLLRGSYCRQFVGTSSLQLGRLVKVDCIKLVTIAILGPSI